MEARKCDVCGKLVTVEDALSFSQYLQNSDKTVRRDFCSTQCAREWEFSNNQLVIIEPTVLHKILQQKD